MFVGILLTLLILLIILFPVLLAIYPVKTAAEFNSHVQTDVNVVVSWLGHFFKAYILRQNNHMILAVNMLNRRIYTRNLGEKENVNMRLKGKRFMRYANMIKYLEINNAKLTASYGFLDPSVTGVLYAAINFITQNINLDEMYNNADFFADQSYFNISAEAEINAAASIIRILKRNRNYVNAHALGGNR